MVHYNRIILRTRIVMDIMRPVEGWTRLASPIYSETVRKLPRLASTLGSIICTSIGYQERKKNFCLSLTNKEC